MADTETRYHVLRNDPADYYDNEEDALHEASCHNPPLAVVPVYVPPMNVEEDTPEPPKRRASSVKKADG